MGDHVVLEGVVRPQFGQLTDFLEIMCPQSEQGVRLVVIEVVSSPLMRQNLGVPTTRIFYDFYSQHPFLLGTFYMA